MKIAFLGAGAVGGYFGGLLAQAGHSVGFVARGETLEQLRTTGLTLIDADDQTTVVRDCAAASDFASLSAAMGGLDVILIATKVVPGNETFADAESLNGVPIVTVHNSVEIHDVAAERFGESNVIAAVVRGFMEHLAPAKVKFHPGPLSLDFGTYDKSTTGHSADVARALRDALDSAQIGGAIWEDIFVDVWSKAMFVTTTGVLGALADKPLGYLRTELRDSLRGLMEEVAAAGRAHGVGLPDDVVERTLGFADQQIPEATASMQRDIRDGLSNELDSQVGAIRRKGAAAGVPTPLHDLGYGVLAARLSSM